MAILQRVSYSIIYNSTLYMVSYHHQYLVWVNRSQAISKLSPDYSWRQEQTRLVVYTTNPMECIVVVLQRQHAHEP